VTDPASPSPALSIVVVVLAGRASLAACLDALQRQEDVSPIELIVPFDDRNPDVDALRARYPEVRFERVPGRRTYAEVRAAGMRLARAPIAALTEDHCRPGPGWAHAIVAAHRAAHAAIGGPVELAPGGSALDASIYLLDYARYAMPLPAGPAPELTDCNVSYKSGALGALRGLWEREFHEPRVHAALAERGESLWFAPEVAVQQRRALTLRGAIWERYAFGRLLGSVRAQDAPPARRALLAATAAAIPPLQVLRVLGHARRSAPLRPVLARALPYVLVMATAWGIGELVGYLTGTPEASLAPSAD
jgi:hypothetical protein